MSETEKKSKKACPEALSVQLAELNARSRAYTSQIWQVPFAYVGIVGVVLGQMADESSRVLGSVMLGGGLFGIAVLVHMTAMVDGVKRAVSSIQEVEKKLTLETTARYKGGWYLWPFMYLVGLVMVGLLVVGGYLFHKGFPELPWNAIGFYFALSAVVIVVAAVVNRWGPRKATSEPK